MKSLNENIGLSGGNGMSHFDGKAFDVNADSAVIASQTRLNLLKTELEDLTKELTFWIKEEENIRGSDRNCIEKNPDEKSYWECNKKWIAPAWEAWTRNLARINARIPEVKKEIVVAQLEYDKAKTAAIEANNKIIEAEIKLLAEKAKTDPEALKQVTALNAQKIENEKALAKSSNIKIYVIVGAVILAFGALAGLWIWLKSRKAV